MTDDAPLRVRPYCLECKAFVNHGDTDGFAHQAAAHGDEAMGADAAKDWVERNIHMVVEAKCELYLAIDAQDGFTRPEMKSMLAEFRGDLRALAPKLEACFDILEMDSLGEGLLDEEDILWAKRGATAWETPPSPCTGCRYKGHRMDEDPCRDCTRANDSGDCWEAEP